MSFVGTQAEDDQKSTARREETFEWLWHSVKKMEVVEHWFDSYELHCV